MSTEEPTSEETTLKGLPVKLELFEGPLDLLLHLIRDNKVDIADIPIASITEQYLGYLDLMRTLSLDVAGEFLVVAATLLHIKSRMLLPYDEEEGVEEGEDPREELVKQLQEYQRYRDAGATLGELAEFQSHVFGRGSVGPEAPKRTDFPIEVSLFELLAAMKKLMETIPEEQRIEILRDQLSVADKIADILEFFKRAEGEIPFEDLFRPAQGLPEVIVTFLAILELMKLRMIMARQVEARGRIFITDIRPKEEMAEEEMAEEEGAEEEGAGPKSGSGEDRAAEDEEEDLYSNSE